MKAESPDDSGASLQQDERRAIAQGQAEQDFFLRTSSATHHKPPHAGAPDVLAQAASGLPHVRLPHTWSASRLGSRRHLQSWPKHAHR